MLDLLVENHLAAIEAIDGLVAERDRYRKAAVGMENALRAVNEIDKLHLAEIRKLQTEVVHNHNLFDCPGCQGEAMHDDLLKKLDGRNRTLRTELVRAALERPA